ncbi:MAG: hypothetical protein U1E42_13215 [Rhodospirillales bacterium]
MVLPTSLLPSRTRRWPGLLAGTLVILLCAGSALPAAADGGLPSPGPTPLRSRLHVEIPGYTAYYVPEPPAPPVKAAPPAPARTPESLAEPAPAAPAVPVATGAPVPQLATSAPPPSSPRPLPMDIKASDGAANTLLAVAETPASDAAADLVVAYKAENVDVPAVADPRLQALAQRMRQEPTMVIALEGFAGGGDSLRARRLAMWRARAVRTRLIEDGVASQRIRLRAAEAEAGTPATERVDVRIVQP